MSDGFQTLRKKSLQIPMHNAKYEGVEPLCMNVGIVDDIVRKELDNQKL